MKLDARRVEGFLRDPGSCRLVLLYGDDAGLIHERGSGLVRTVAGSLDDPFRVADLTHETHSRLAEEASALSLMGGRRVVRVREVTDALAASVRSVLDREGEALVVLEAPGLTGRSRLRTLAEAAPDAVAIGCYPEEGRSLDETIRTTLAAEGITAGSDAMQVLTSRLGADRATTRQELEKLTLLVGQGGRVDLDVAMACIGDMAGLSLDDAMFAATAGEVGKADRALEMALSEGASPVAVIRSTLVHVQRLHRARLEMASGLSGQDAVRGLRPPLFFRRTGPFLRALDLWSADALLAAGRRLAEAESACKRTGSPTDTLCRQAVLGLARMAAVRSRSAGAPR